MAKSVMGEIIKTSLCLSGTHDPFSRVCRRDDDDDDDRTLLAHVARRSALLFGINKPSSQLYMYTSTCCLPDIYKFYQVP